MMKKMIVILAFFVLGDSVVQADQVICSDNFQTGTVYSPLNGALLNNALGGTASVYWVSDWSGYYDIDPITSGNLLGVVPGGFALANYNCDYTTTYALQLKWKRGLDPAANGLNEIVLYRNTDMLSYFDIDANGILIEFGVSGPYAGTISAWGTSVGGSSFGRNVGKGYFDVNDFNSTTDFADVRILFQGQGTVAHPLKLQLYINGEVRLSAGLGPDPNHMITDLDPNRMSTVAGFGRYWFADDFVLSTTTTPMVDTCASLWVTGRGNQYDLNHDCKINLRDFAMFAEAWLFCNNPAPAGGCP